MYHKKRPNTWNPVSLTKKSPSISRTKRWKSQQRKRASRSSTVASNRQTITTISTLTFSNKNSIHWQHHRPPFEKQDPHGPHGVFHTQSLLFLFGFLFFPCWWAGAFYVKFVTKDIETTTVVIHPSMIANGKTTSKLFQLPLIPMNEFNESPLDEVLFFHRWNRYMSVFSIFLFIVEISMLIWYLTLI